MITILDKAIAGAIVSGLLWLNNKYGFHFDTSSTTGTAIQGLVDAALTGLVVWVVPNKVA